MALVRTKVCIKKFKISTVLLKENVPLNFWLSIYNGSKGEKIMYVHTNPSFCRYIHHKEQSFRIFITIGKVIIRIFWTDFSLG
jgi:hypothetical protein